MTDQVEAERGLPIGVVAFTRVVTATLSDRRSWATGGHDLEQVTSGADIRVVLATPETTDELCAPLDTGGRLSCRNGSDVVINAWRWLYGAPSYANDLQRYRQYVINHEVGHALGYPHAACPGSRELAPVMVQQTKGLQGCRANPWPARADLL